MFKYSKILKTLILIVAIGTVVSFCSKKERSDEQNANISYEDVTKAIESQLLASPFVKPENVKVETTEGVVTLSGESQSLLAKRKAEEIAGSVKGVRSVVNNLQVESDRPDNEIITSVRNALKTDPVTQPLEITAEINKGVVTLKGVSHSWAQRRLAGDIAASVKDVTHVQNNILVQHDRVPAPDEIQKVVKRAIKWDSRIFDAMLEVSVDGQTVHLTGAVPSLKQKNLAVQKAHVEGVERVNADSLKVRPAYQSEMVRTEWAKNRPDAEIRKAIEDALTYDPRVAAFKISVEVNDGVATLSGKVDNLNAKMAAGADARNTVGVTSVENNITVENKVIVRPDISVTDKAVQKRAELAINRSEILEAREINVTVTNGIATVEGSVESKFEKQHTNDILQDVIGILSINNNLSVTT